MSTKMTLILLALGNSKEFRAEMLSFKRKKANSNRKIKSFLKQQLVMLRGTIKSKLNPVLICKIL